MKKVFALVLALALALSMAVMASAAAADDFKTVAEDLAATVGLDQLKSAFDEVWAKVSKELDLPQDTKDLDAKDLPEDTGATVADGLISKLGLEGTDIAAKLQDAMSNDFVSFLAGMYTGVDKPIVTGDSSATVIAIASFAALSAVAAAAFVVMKKKEA